MNNILHEAKGFTIVEVAIVLAVTGLMLVGILGGINVRVAAQRYNDTVQGVEDFLRSVYSEVINVENGRADVVFNQTYCSGPLQVAALKKNASTKIIEAGEAVHAGRSDCSIYGKLVTFGEENKTVAHVYTVVGQLRASDLSESVSSVLDSLKVVGADAYAFNYGQDITQCVVDTAGTASTYTPLWDARLEAADDSGDLLKTAYLVVRSPISGAVHTYRLKPGSTVNIAEQLGNAFGCGGSSAAPIITKSNEITGINYHLEQNNFEVGDVDICINSADLYAAGSSRRNLRINADGRNTSAVEFVETDSEDNRCR